MDAIKELLALQSGVVSRQQLLENDMAEHDLRRLLRRRELVRMHPGVYIDHTGVPNWIQEGWAAVLSVWPAALSHVSALRAAEGPGSRDSGGPIHVAVDRQRHVGAPKGVRLHRVTELHDRVLWNASPPRIRYEEAALDVAATAPSDFTALGEIARACQSRRTTAARMVASLQDRRRTPRRQWLMSVLEDVAEGSCSVLEWGYARHVERAHRLPRAERQRRVAATLGLTYRDAQFRTLVIELDGRMFHDTTRQRDRDMDRDLDAAVAGGDALRLSYGQVFDRPCHTAARLAVVLQRHGWRGRPRSCGPDCSVRWPAATG